MRKQISFILAIIFLVALVPNVALADVAGVSIMDTELEYGKTYTSASNIVGTYIKSGSITIGEDPKGDKLMVILNNLLLLNKSTGNDDGFIMLEFDDNVNIIVNGENSIIYNNEYTGTSGGQTKTLLQCNEAELSGEGMIYLNANNNDSSSPIIGINATDLKLDCGFVKTNIDGLSSIGINATNLYINGGNNTIKSKKYGIEFSKNIYFNGGTTQICGNECSIKGSNSGSKIIYQKGAVIVPSDAVFAQSDKDTTPPPLLYKDTVINNILITEFIVSIPASSAGGNDGAITYTHDDWLRDNQYDAMAPASGLEPDKKQDAEQLYGPMTTPVPETAAPTAAPVETPPQTADAISPIGFILLAMAAVAIIMIVMRKKQA